jgi:hypothetical protein
MLGRIEADAAVAVPSIARLCFSAIMDRGPDSRGVVEMLIGGLQGFEAHFLKGNHEVSAQFPGDAWTSIIGW